MQDRFGTEITIGTVVCYPQQSGHRTSMGVGIVDKINLNDDGTPRSVRVCVGGTYYPSKSTVSRLDSVLGLAHVSADQVIAWEAATYAGLEAKYAEANAEWARRHEQ